MYYYLITLLVNIELSSFEHIFLCFFSSDYFASLLLLVTNCLACRRSLGSCGVVFLNSHNSYSPTQHGSPRKIHRYGEGIHVLSHRSSHGSLDMYLCSHLPSSHELIALLLIVHGWHVFSCLNVVCIKLISK